jgi:hypothetical protein
LTFFVSPRSSSILATQIVHVTSEAKARPIITTFTMMSAFMNMPHGDRSRGSMAFGGGRCAGVAVATALGVVGATVAGVGVGVIGAGVIGAGVAAVGVVGAICASAGAPHSAMPAMRATMRARPRRAGRMVSRFGAAVVMA